MKLFEIENIRFDEIKNNCRQWLNEVEEDVYRGTRLPIKNIEKRIPRKNREAQDTSQVFNNVYNTIYSETPFARKELIFTGSKTVAMSYSYDEPYIFIPADGYSYIWFPVRDTLQLQYHCIELLRDDVPEEEFEKMIDGNLKDAVLKGRDYLFRSKMAGFIPSGEFDQNRIKKFFKKYERINQGINEAVRNNYEIGINCDFYYLIPSELMETTAGATGAGAVASLTGGFDPNGEWRSIYNKTPKKKNKKQPLLKR